MIPLLGRPYIYGELDCYTLVRDYYQSVLQIELPLPPEYVGLSAASMDLIAHNFMSRGFQAVEIPEEHDVIVMACNSETPNHLGVFVAGRYILHHCEHRVSSKDAYGNTGLWDKQTVFYLRHIDLL